MNMLTNGSEGISSPHSRDPQDDIFLYATY